MPTLDGLENRLQSLLEVHLLKYLPGYKTEDKVIQQLAASMQGNLKEKEGIVQAPNVYLVVAHPSTLTLWNAEARLLEEMANALVTAGDEAGFQFTCRPTVTTAADTSLPAGELHVIASFRNETVGETLGMPAETKEEVESGKVPSNAFLIMGGTQVIPLDQSVMNIGRRLDNQIIVDDPRVSRTHAQLRVVKDRFVLFDLNSTGGTFVNGERINQSVLYPGDVISLAGIALVFGQELPGERSASDSQTQPRSPVSGERATAILSKDKYR
jgi:FHA domain/Protein of unknown function (DUF3662)